MHPRPRLTFVAALALLLVVSGCATGTTATPGQSLRPLGSGYLGSITMQMPEPTLSPLPGSWDGVVPPAGYRAIVISRSVAGDPGNADATRAIGAAVERWAAQYDVDLQSFVAADDDEVERHLDAAVALSPDLVLGAGSGVVDVFSLLTAQNLGQEFLMVGAQLPEPTANVTAAVWAGATFRGTGVSVPADQVASAVTVQRAEDAVTAGVAGVLHGLSGVVVRLTF
ncbi:BMP family ABC transporter substrate-binding protein [Cryobacterium melibiosiphilum]|uniref:BMP family ABC transporter substrate-binding protein n=1 Tax=Cryobacterium melibiosiphilum TaxID=995039 RepID=A0A3A5MYD5_9MICO|nr:BMP family ABC transporter substrate-binding protein [Cryobacterium melibiosiphilum]RJT91046.1 BMP family ABC transporter substrate-binding protein [Cryobacterium melibiosiphilum]